MKKLTLSLLIIAIAFIACKKDNKEIQTVNVPLIKSRIITLPDGSIHDSVVYEYNAEGKFIGGKTKNGGRIVVEYNASTITFKEYDNKSILGRTETATLNSQGWISEYSYVDESEKINDHQKFFFDDQGHNVKSIDSYSNNIDTSFNSFIDDNVTTTIARHWGYSTLSIDTTQFEYYTDKLSTIELNNQGFPTFGKPNKNLVKKKTYGNEVTEYAYDFDTQNRVIKETVSYKGEVSYYVDFTYVEK